MVKIFSWILVICIALLIIASTILPFTAIHLVDSVIFLIFVVGLISAAGLIITLIFERIKNRKEDDDAFNKY